MRALPPLVVGGCIDEIRRSTTHVSDSLSRLGEPCPGPEPASTAQALEELAQRPSAEIADKLTPDDTLATRCFPRPPVHQATDNREGTNGIR